MTSTGIQIWCARHDINIVSVDVDTASIDPVALDVDRLEKLLDHLEDSCTNEDALAYYRAANEEWLKTPGVFEDAWKEHTDCMED